MRLQHIGLLRPDARTTRHFPAPWRNVFPPRCFYRGLRLVFRVSSTPHPLHRASIAVPTFAPTTHPRRQSPGKQGISTSDAPPINVGTNKMTNTSQPTFLANPTSEKAGPNFMHDLSRSKLRECVVSGHFRPHGRFHRPQHWPPRDGQHHGRDGVKSYDPFGCQWASTPCTEAQRANPRASAREMFQQPGGAFPAQCAGQPTLLGPPANPSPAPNRQCGRKESDVWNRDESTTRLSLRWQLNSQSTPQITERFSGELHVYRQRNALLSFCSLQRFRVRRATYCRSYHTRLVAPSGFLNLSTLYSPRTLLEFVSPRRHSWDLSLQRVSLTGKRALLSNSCPS